MGPQTKNVEVRSQATPMAEDFLAMMQGYLDQLKSPTAGPENRETGSSPRQFDTSFAKHVGGIDTSSFVTDETPGLIKSVTANANRQTDRNAAETRESMGLMGNRFGTALPRVEGQQRNEAGMNLQQLIGSILMEQSGREQSARQFDVQANQNALVPFTQMASSGIIPDEIIASPSVFSQLLTALATGAGAYFSGGGTLGKGTPQPPGAIPSQGGGIYSDLPPAQGRRN